jgi:hypothetical protein
MTNEPTRTDSGKFKKGISGNPKGRPKQESALIRQELAKHSDDIIEKVIAQALGGCTQSQKMILDRISPALKPINQPSLLEVPEGATFTEMAKLIVQQSISGEVDPGQAVQLLNAITQLKPAIQSDKQVKSMTASHGFGSAFMD